MADPDRPGLSRRELIRLGLAACVSTLVAACRQAGMRAPSAEPEARSAATPTAGGVPAQPAAEATPLTQARSLPPTPQCPDEDEPTIAQTEGPFYTPNSPERRSLLEAGISGTRLVVTGSVLSTGCRPVAGALVDFWHADDAGQYDNAGYRLRGHQFTDQEGGYRLETVVPGAYIGRTRHIHVKVQPRGGSLLTTQLYFPGEPRNEQDAIFDPRLLMDVRDSGDGKRATFDFVVEMG